MNKFILCAILALVASAASGAPNPKEAKKNNNQPILSGDSFDITSDDITPDEFAYSIENENKILAYNPVDPKPIRVNLSPAQSSNKLKSSSFTDLEREASHSSADKPKVANVMAEGDDAERSGSPNVDKIKDIAMNSREVRLVGPNQREVEMKDDLPTKVVVALENLQKEAKELVGQMNDKLDQGWTEIKRSEVWGQVNEKLDKGWTDIKRSEVWGQVNDKLDKGWTDFKSMVEGVVSPSSSKSQG